MPACRTRPWYRILTTVTTVPTGIIALAVLLAASLLLAASDGRAESIRVPLDLDASQLRQVVTPEGMQLLLPDARVLRDFGEPSLPYRPMQVLIPRDCRVRGIRIEGGERVPVIAKGPLALDSGQAVDGVRFQDERLFAAALIEQAGVFPPEAARLASDGFHHGYHVVTVHVYPLRQDRSSGALWLRQGGELVLELEPWSAPFEIADRAIDLSEWDQRVARQLSRRIANPSAVPGYSRPAPTIDPEQMSLDKTPNLAPSPVRYLIITNDQMQPEFQRLADYRSTRGLPGAVVTISEILANYRQGVDLAETIRLYIADAYSKLGVDYVLLGGDSDVIPPRYVNSTFYPPGGSTDIPSDLYYAALDGNWNDDGDGTFGEPFISGLDLGDFVDFAPEVALGRATVSTLAEAQVFVDKTIEYEVPTNVGYQASALLASEVLFPQNWELLDPIQLDGAVFSEDIADTIDACAPHGDYTYTKLYENHTAYPGAIEEFKATVLAELNAGTHGVFHHIGHGFYFNMSVGDNNVLVSDADALSNGPNYFNLYALNCSSAAFDFNCLMERFLRNPNGGSAVSIGSSRAAFPNTANDYQQSFYGAVFCDGFTRVGDAVLESRLEFAADTFYNTSDRWTHFVYTLLGDPALAYWTAVPRTISVSAPASVGLGPQNITVTVTDVAAAGPMAGATVALSKGGEDYAVGITDVAGQVTLGFDAETVGNIQLSVSGANAYPSSSTIGVTAAGGPFISVQSFSIAEDGSGASSGNGNGRPEGGETIEMTVLVRNTGGGASAGGTLTFQTIDPYITISDAAATFGPLAAGASALATGTFVFDLFPTVLDAYEATFDVVATEGGVGSWTDTEIITLSNPELETILLEIDDSAGNGNGIVDVGEDIVLTLTLKNFGSGAVGSVSGVLTSADINTTVSDAGGSWGAMPDVLDTADNALDRFTVNESNVATPISYDLTLTDDEGRVQVVNFDLRRPAAPVDVVHIGGGPGEVLLKWSPNTDADLRGYRIYRREAGMVVYDTASADIVEGSSRFRDEGLPGLTRFEYLVVAVDDGSLESDPSVLISASTAPPEALCFPLPMGQESSGALAVGHLEWDGVLDMVIGSDVVYVIDGNCEEKVNGDNDSQTFGPINNIDGGYQPAGIALGEMDGIPGLEIVASNWTTKQLHVLDEAGNLLPGWPVQLQDKTWSTPSLGDLDNDGDLEIVVHDTKGYTYAFHHDGTELIDGDLNPATLGPVVPRESGGAPVVYEAFGRSTPALYDVDNDGQLEILYGTKFSNANVDEKLHAFKIDGSGEAAGWPKNLGIFSEILCSPTIADIDNDSVDEIIVLCEDDSLYVWHPDGTPVAPFPKHIKSQSVNAISLTPSVAVGDFTGDDNLEMVVVSVEGAAVAKVYLIDHLGVVLPGWPVTVPSLSESSPVVGDINGDGQLDIVFGIGGGADNLPNLLYGWNKDGTEIDGFPITLGGFVRATPTICDLDGDGTVNIALATWDKQIHVWDMGASYDESLVPWPTFRGNVYRNGVFGSQVATPVPDGGRPTVARATLWPSVPNPFNPVTTIRFEVPGAVATGVRLSIFDSAGREVARLVEGSRGPGAHEVRWFGMDSTGRRVSSGVYFARLEVDGYGARTQKMALVK